MEYLTKKLPFILSAVMALFTGILGFLANKNYNFIYTSMLISILIFGLIGFIIRGFITAIFDEIKKKEEDAKKAASEKDNEVKGSVIDLKADDSQELEDIEIENDISKNPEVNDFYTDGFSPLEVSKVVKTSINEDE